jgi:hypothetical protein
MRVILSLLLLILVYSGCNNRRVYIEDKYKYLPVMTNEVLKENIVEYVKTNSQNLIILEFSLSHDTIIYTIYNALSMFAFVEPNVSAIIKMDSIYIGYRNLNVRDIEMPTKAIIDILMDYPLFRDCPDMFFRRKKQNESFESQNEDYEIFVAVTGSVNIWTLKLIDGALVSRSVYSEYDGSTKCF